jgi:hypothetical protein
MQQPKTLETYCPRIYGFRVHTQRGRLPLALGDALGTYAVESVSKSAGVVKALGAAASSSSSSSSASSAFSSAAAAGGSASGPPTDVAEPPKDTTVAGAGGAGANKLCPPSYLTSVFKANPAPRRLDLVPLTKTYPNWQRPAEDDFHSSSDDNSKSQCGPVDLKKPKAAKKPTGAAEDTKPPAAGAGAAGGAGAGGAAAGVSANPFQQHESKYLEALQQHQQQQLRAASSSSSGAAGAATVIKEERPAVTIKKEPGT